MLVLSRRENDRIDFPTLGISIEVLQLTRSRASLGIVAPRGVRIVRHELIGTRAYGSPCQTERDDSAVDDPVGNDVLSNELEAATEKMERAHQQLVRGDSQQALKAIAEGLAELDQIRAALSSSAESRDDFTLNGNPTDSSTAKLPKPAPLAKFAKRASTETNAVSESVPGYQVANKPSNDDNGFDPAQRSVVLLVQSMDHNGGGLSLSSSLANGFDGNVQTTDRPMTVLYELSRYEKPDAVLFASGLDPEKRDATVRLIRDCSQYPDVPVVQMDDADRVVCQH